MKKYIEILVNHFEDVIVEKFGNELSGSCYLIGHCLNEVFKKKNIRSRKVTGKLSLLYNKSNDGKYAYYGSLKLRGKNVGYYHTWCEVLIDERWYIVDPSIKYNIKAIKRIYNIKISKKIPGFIFTDNSRNYFYKYYEDESLDSFSLEYLNKMSQNQIDDVINETLRKLD